MDSKELKEKTDKELDNLLKSQREKKRELAFKISAKQLKNIREIREVKKTIARILTLFNQRSEKKESLEGKEKQTKERVVTEEKIKGKEDNK